MPKPPAVRSRFLSQTDELNYVGDMVRYHFAQSSSNGKLAVYLYRLRRLLNEFGVDDGSINLQEHWILFYEAADDLRGAIVHREKLITLVHRLQEMGGFIGPFDEKYLADAIEILENHRARLAQAD